MSADWWDIYGSPAEAAERRCWICDEPLRMATVSPDGSVASTVGGRESSRGRSGEHQGPIPVAMPGGTRADCRG